MSKVALHLGHHNVSDKVALARGVVAKMTGNASFATPDVSLTTLAAAADATEKAEAKTQQDHKAWLASASAQRDAEHNLDELLRGEARYVDRASNGDETIIKSSGFEIAASPVKSTSQLGAPTKLSSSDGDHGGEIDLHWNRVAGARSYQIATADASDGPWAIAMASTRSKAVLSGVASGKKLWIRVAALDANGLGAWSAPIQASAP